MVCPRLAFPLEDIVEVEWSDACSSGEWKDVNIVREHHSILPARTLGYLVSQDKHQIILSQTQALNDDVGGTMAIPTSWVMAIRKLGKTPKITIKKAR